MTVSRKDLANSIRALSMDAVQAANSGHPGMPMGMADIAEVLWNDFLKHNPKDPTWPNRDRFILSNGHGSMLQYSLLYLTGYDLSIEEIKNFRKLHSKTPGHPEFGIAPGVEVSTGPLGQGITNAVGMALAEALLANEFNKPDANIVDHHTYCLLGDGCLMEGVSHEACSLAGTLKLGKLIAIWDDNGISIDGKTDSWFDEDVVKRFQAYHWQVIENIDGHDPDAIKQAITKARANTNQPTLICCKTKIGFGAPNLQDTAKCHGAPLGDDEIVATRANIGWNHAAFEIPENIKSAWSAVDKGSELQQDWNNLFKHYVEKYPQLASELKRRLNRDLSSNYLSNKSKLIANLNKEASAIASRKASQKALDVIAQDLPELLGGSADLTGSNLTMHSNSIAITGDKLEGNYIHYGVREFAMAAIMNGIALHGGYIPYGGTFLTFADYARNAIRMSALMQQRVIYVLTHDSIGLGEDGPTHQPIEHLAMLRATPNVSVWRPCDTVETAIAWQKSVENATKPTCLILSRQGLPHQTRDDDTIANIKKGGYILKDAKIPAELDAIILATGSEVSIAIEAQEILESKGHQVRVVSMPSIDEFLAQDIDYQKLVLPDNITKRVAIEAAATQPWYRFVGHQGRVIGIDSFGESAPAKDLFMHFNLHKDALVNEVLDVMKMEAHTQN